tara:strand:+ start:1064 stop:1909 length:846 start_codon:yes stop_codon:yes gene_type:complete
MHSIIKQIANQLKGSLPVNDEKGYTLLFPFESSRDYYLNQSKIFKDPRDDKEYFLKFKNDEERLTEIKKINTVITSYNKVVSKNYREVLSKVPPDGKVHSNKELGFKKPVINFEEEPIWGFIVTGKSKRNGKFKLITIDNRNLYQIRLNFDSDKEFIIYLNREIFNYIQIQRKESEKVGTWNINNIWYKPNQRFHKWFQVKGVSTNQIQKGGRPKGKTKRTIDKYIKVFHTFELMKKKYSSKTRVELYNLLASIDYNGTTYSRKTIRNIIEEKRYNLKPTR